MFGIFYNYLIVFLQVFFITSSSLKLTLRFSGIEPRYDPVRPLIIAFI